MNLGGGRGVPRASMGGVRGGGGNGEAMGGNGNKGGMWGWGATGGHWGQRGRLVHCNHSPSASSPPPPSSAVINANYK